MKHKFDDSCGCALGALFTVAGLLVSSIYYGWAYQANELSLWSVTLRIFAVTFLTSGAGKTLGIFRYRLRHRRSPPPVLPRSIYPPPRGG